MAVNQPTSERNLDGYGSPPIPWELVRERLDAGIPQAPGTGGPERHTSWLTTVRPDGLPHVRPVGALWVDGAFYFNSGPSTRKARNLAADPHCVISVATRGFDLVAEGEAVRVTDEATLQRLADVYAGQGWAPTVRDGAYYAEFSALSAGPPPWNLYEMRPSRVYALGAGDPIGATTWDFQPAGRPG